MHLSIRLEHFDLFYCKNHINASTGTSVHTLMGSNEDM